MDPQGCAKTAGIGCAGVIVVPVLLVTVVSLFQGPSLPEVYAPAKRSEPVMQVAPAEKTQAPPPPPSTGRWIVDEDVSEMDDSRMVTLLLSATGAVSGWLATETPVLVLRCRENETDVYVTVGMQVRSDYPRSDMNGSFARLRYDDSQAVTVETSHSTDGESLFLPNAIGTARRLTQSKRLLFEFTPFNASIQTATFELDGLSEAIKPLREACRWEAEAPPPPPQRPGLPAMFSAFERSAFYLRYRLRPAGELVEKDGQYEQFYSVGGSSAPDIRLWLGNGGVGLVQAVGDHDARFNSDLLYVREYVLASWIK